MLEKYEKPEILSQKMEMNVLRAGCSRKVNTIDQNYYSDQPEWGCNDTKACDGCGVSSDPNNS
jgi:hypothetical protein